MKASTHSTVRFILSEIVGPDPETDGMVLQACGARIWRRRGAAPVMRWPGSRFDEPLPPLTGDIGSARALIARVLPDFWATSGLCALSGHASIGPDYNGSAGERLRQEWPEAEFHAGFDADLSPGDGPHRECAALLDCLLQALERKPTGAIA
ncbi:hypothetical protein MFUR16E_04600 [Methylobacterium fujisawaense]|uniref:hypothetical protein n=1 Tax=Methylobacterium fujisawaense TaxID=107400 RepID=UPI002F2ED0FE